MRIVYHVVSAPAPLGLLFMAATPKGVCRLEFMDRRSLKRTLQTLAAGHPGAEWSHSVSDLRPLAEQLDDFFSGVRERLDWPLDPVGDELQLQVWSALRALSYGQTCTLTQLAKAVGQPQGSRAVAAAVQQNPVAIAIPCHRVVGADGRPTAYVGGLPRKKWLLSHESRFHALPHPEDNRVIAESRVVVKRPVVAAARKKAARTRATASPKGAASIKPGRPAPASSSSTAALAAKPARKKR